MNSKILKVTGAVIFSCLVMIAIVIYTPKPDPRFSKKQRPFKTVNPEYLRLANEALSQVNEAKKIAHEKSHQLLSGEKIDFGPLTAANIAAIDALAEADKSIKLCNAELQNHNKKEESCTILIEANMRLIVSLNKISETVKALNIEVQHIKNELKKEGTQPLSPSIKKFTDVLHTDTITKVTNATKKGLNALRDAMRAYTEYYQLGNIVDR